MSPDRHLMQWPLLLAVGVLTCLVMAVFCPLLNFEFVNFDVKSSVVANPHVHGLTVENVKYIFTTRCIDSYYPIRSLTYATDYSLWGLNPRGYKLTNVLLHWTNVMLVFGLLLRLLGGNDKRGERAPPQQDIAAAAFAAAMFAIHPLVVEPVAWVAGREELLMTLGALGCFHLHLSARRQAAEGAAKNAVRIRHALATGCCLLACLSNAVGAVIPLLVTAWDVMTLRPLKWARVFSSTAPLWLIGIATIASKILGSNEPLAAQSSPVLSSQQLMLIAKVVWLNFKSLAWPVELALSYGAYDKFLPHSFLETEVILGGLVLAAAAFGLWILRRETLPLFGLIWFGLALAPSLHIMPHHIIHADRLLYLSLAGLAITIASGIQLLNKRLKVRAFRIGTCLVGLLVLGLLCYRSTQQVQTWRNSITMWENCVRVNPDDAFIHDALARSLAARGHWDRVEEHAQRSLELDLAEGNYLAIYKRAMGLALAPNLQLEDRQQAVELAERACNLTQRQDAQCLAALPVTYCSLANAQVTEGQFAAALDNYRKALQADPAYSAAKFNMSFLLATCRDQSLRDPEQAIRLAEEGCQAAGKPTPDQLRILAEAYASAGRLDAAIATAERAGEIAQQTGNTALLQGIQRWIEDCRQQAP